MPDLNDLGWNPFFEEAFAPYKAEGHSVGRVALEYQSLYRIYTEAGEMLAEVTGKFHFQAESRSDFPAVGDWVVITPFASEKKAVIHTVLPRRSAFSRKVAGAVTEEQIVASNIDTIFLVQGLDGDYNLRRIERYLTVALESGAEPVVILSKADLSDEVEERRLEVERVALGVPVHAISSVKNLGLEQLNQYLCAGLTIAFLGSSGAGKSTLINRLMGKDVQKVREVRARDDRGRHTTVHRELIILPAGGLLIDTPGMRELQLWDAGEGLSDTFADIDSLGGECYFSNCRHENEPGCAIKEALEDGSLDAARVENYKKMQKELEYLDSRQDSRARREKERSFGRLYKSVQSEKKRRYE
ncbi:MAG: ribosome small subunit-dependent GTPase A [Blastocatellia bacterium]|nr:ribosome small subunit-dependent GTPase A [Blastocatellia bacterium]